MSRPDVRRSRGFTLMEMVTSCLVISLLMVTLGYALKLALVSTGNGATQAAATLDAGDVVGRITDDLNEAINFTEKTSSAVTFTVPDRDGDGNVEKIRYVWWPTAGTYTILGTGSSGSGGSGSGSGSGSGGSGGGGLLGGLLGVPNSIAWPRPDVRAALRASPKSAATRLAAISTR